MAQSIIKMAMSKTILDLNAVSAKRFFLSQEAYSNIELPQYINFDKLLNSIDKQFLSKELTDGELRQAKNFETINHVLYGNKDGKYAWRKYEIIHPFIYVSLVNIITKEKNWKLLIKKFEEFKRNKNIRCESLPALPNNASKQKQSQVTQWVNEVERKSMELSMEYGYIFQTDITDCYGSLYTHSISWAIHTKQVSKVSQKDNSLLGNSIDNHVQAMTHGQTNGIPQGSILMDFIAEIVLGYIDMELFKKLSPNNLGKYYILRYRDDYRIFTNSVNDGDIILKCLSETLMDFGFQLNTAKTCCHNDVITGSVKADKMDSLRLPNIPRRLSKRELVRHLLLIQQIGKEFPNSGTVKKRLSRVLDVVHQEDFRGQQNIISGLVINIAYNSPSSFPIAASLISNCTLSLQFKNRTEIIKKVKDKICTLANIGLMEIWIQRMSIGSKLRFPFNEKLCQAVYGKKQSIFVNDWISNKKIKKIIDDTSVIDEVVLKKTKALIKKNEVQMFRSYDSYSH